MSVIDLADLKKRLRAEGFEIYRTLPERVQLAERVRDNLIMDSGVSVALDGESPLAVLVTVRAQASHFPGTDEVEVSAAAEKLALGFAQSGYERLSAEVHPVPDPSDPAQSLDTSYEVSLRRPLKQASDLFEELRRALNRPRHSSDD